MANKTYNNYITTCFGRKIDFINPTADQIFIEDIAKGLSNICRFGGLIMKFYSVAQHSVYVSQLVGREFALQGLLHDSSEGLGLVDLISQVKHSGLLPGYIKLEKKMMDAVYTRFNLSIEEPEEVKIVDKLVLRQEQFCLRNQGKDKPFTFHISPWTPAKAEREFLKRFNELTKVD